MNLTLSKLSFVDRNRAADRLAKAKSKLHADTPQMSSTYVLRSLTGISVLLTSFILVFLIGYILVKGIPNLRWSLFALEYTPENVSMLPSIINTLLMTGFTLALSVPVGISAAVYLTEYARKGSRLVKIIRLATETLSGIPSIVYGLFGYLCFVIALKWEYSFLAGCCTLAIMILPLLVRTAEEALLAVPDSYREASFGLGAGKLRTVFCVVLPNSIPGILAGVILAIGRIAGESAALIFTAGTVPNIPKNLFSSSRTLSVHLYALISEGLYTNQAYATSVVLVVMVIGINLLSYAAAKCLTQDKTDK